MSFRNVGWEHGKEEGRETSDEDDMLQIIAYI